jgi:hypothetical protein
MNKLVFASAFLFLVPTLCAQQPEPKSDSSHTAPKVEPQPTPQNSNAQTNLPASLRPGHPLDPADVAILTGKRERETEAARSSVMISSEPGAYGSVFEVGLLPLTQISNPYLFSRWRARGFGRVGFGHDGFRGRR